MKLSKDKKKHLLAGIIIGLLLPLACLYIWPEQLSIALWTGLISIAATGLGFELFSFLISYGYPSLLIIIITVAGGVIGITLVGMGYTLF